MSSLLVRRAGPLGRRPARRRGARQPGHLRQRDFGERAPDRAVYALPDVADAAVRFDAAVAVLAAAFGDRERSFQCVENARRADLARRASELGGAVAVARP